MNVSTGRSRVGLVVAVGLIFLFVCESARVATPPMPIYTLHIEAQPLDGALQEFARQTGKQILFFSRLTDGRRSTALDGKYALGAALTALLSDSDLTYRMVNAKTIEIVPRPASARPQDRSSPRTDRRHDLQSIAVTRSTQYTEKRRP